MTNFSGNPVFLRNIAPRRAGLWHAARQQIFSMGAIHYYVNETGLGTRFFVHNYLNFLAGGSFPAIWKATLYGETGNRVSEVSGKLNDGATAVLDVGKMGLSDRFGVAHIHLAGRSSTHSLSVPYSSVFFAEYFTPRGTRIHAHSLGSPLTSHFGYYRLSTGWHTPSGFRPILLIANGCHFHPFLHTRCGNAKITFINYKNERVSHLLEKLRPLASAKLDLFSILPGLESHLAQKPYSIEIKGSNILSKPYVIQIKENCLMGEHI